jgi:DNA-binding NarL/FixJ family response regulator
MPIRVGIIEDEKEIRESLRILINGSEGFECLHVFSGAEEAVEKIPSLDIDVVLTDIHLADKTGIDCVVALKPLCTHTQFMMCTSFEDTEYVFKALKAGATGYLTKTTQPSKLLDAIVEVYNGGSPMSSQIARKVVASFQGSERNPELEKLSPREQEILHALMQGLRYKEIADKLFVSTETVRTHIRNIYQKLQVNSRTEALNKVFKK